MLENLIIKQAIAQDAQVSKNSEIGFGSFVPLILIFAVFYFLIIRPQNKKIKDHQAMISNLKIGTKVITNSGILGTIKDIDNKENQVEIEIAPGIIVKMIRSSVTELIDKKNEKSANKNIKNNSKK